LVAFQFLVCELLFVSKVKYKIIIHVLKKFNFILTLFSMPLGQH